MKWIPSQLIANSKNLIVPEKVGNSEEMNLEMNIPTKMIVVQKMNIVRDDLSK